MPATGLSRSARAALSIVETAVIRIWRQCALEPAVGYIGWQGHGNLGDEALYAAICRKLSPMPVSPFGGACKERLLGALQLNGPSVFSGIILGGGTLINAGYLPIVRRALEIGIPMYSFGTGVGSAGFGEPIESDLDGWAEALNAFRRVTVRGPDSKQALEKIGVRNVEVVGDPALGLALLEIPKRRTVPRLIINLAAPTPTTYRDLPLQGLSLIAQSFANSGGEVIGMALCKEDKEPLQAFMQEARMDASMVKVCDSIPAIFQLLSGSTAVVGVRLHSAVLACAAGVPPILMCYRSKCLDFLRSVGLARYGVLLDSTSEANLKQAWDTLVGDLGLPEAIHRSAHQWGLHQSKLAMAIREELGHSA